MTGGKKHRKQGCVKRGFSKRKHAEAALAKIRDVSGSLSMRVYRCTRCGKWHMGHDKGWRNE